MSPTQWLFLLLALSAAMATIWFTFELVLVKWRLHPITWYERSWANRHYYLSAVVWLLFAFVAGIAATHFFLDAPCQPFGH